MIQRLAASALMAVAVIVLLQSWHGAASTPLEEGMAMYQLGRYAEALPLLLRAVRAEPKSARAWTWLGATYLQLNRVAEAVDALKRAVALDPRSAAAHYFLGIAYTRAGEVDKARIAFQRVRSLAPDSSYGESAVRWLTYLASTTSPPQAQDSSARAISPVALPCPVPAALPSPVPPPDVKLVDSPLELSLFEIKLQKEGLLITGEIENLEERDFQNVRIQATGFGVNGRQLPGPVTTVVKVLDAGDVTMFSLKLRTTPPPIWIRLQILDAQGLEPGERLHVIQSPVDVTIYAPLAKNRIRIKTLLLPPEPAVRHTVCLQISDNANLPVQMVRVKVTLAGAARERRTRQTKSVDVTAERGGSWQVEWPYPVIVSEFVEIESVQFAPIASSKKGQ